MVAMMVYQEGSQVSDVGVISAVVHDSDIGCLLWLSEEDDDSS